MNFRFCSLLLAAALAAGCGGAPKNKEAIRQGVVEHVTRNGLDINQMNVEVTTVEYKGKEALATVSFAPKNQPGQGMAMNYTLEQQGNKWIVKGKAGGGMGAAHPGAGMPGAAGQGSGAMPPGHPPTGATGQANPSDLPPGHPPVGGAKPNPVAPADPTNPTKK